jgi:formylmethanofuran dehydrogenase subunit C
VTALIEIKCSAEDCLADFTFDFYWQHGGYRLDPDQIVGGFTRRQIVAALKAGEDVRINGDAGDRLGSSLGVDLIKLGGKGGPISGTGSLIVDGCAGKRMGISMLRGSIYLSGQTREPLGNVIEVETDRTGYRKFISITEALEMNPRVLEPNYFKEGTLFINDRILRDTIGARNNSAKSIQISGDCGMSTGILTSGGSIRVLGSVDRNTGVLMKGGKIVVMGHAGDFTAAEMKNGEIFVKGKAGNYACAKMRGGSVYAQKADPVPPAKEYELNQNEKSTLIQVLGLNPIHAMMYKRYAISN